MELEECTEIIRRHPELILMSNCPVTWEGLLTVPLNFAEKRKVKIKLTLPNFPHFRDADLKFGKSYGTFQLNHLKDESNRLLRSAISVSSFLTKLQLLVRDTSYNNSPSLSHVVDSLIIAELEVVMRSPCEVRLSSSHGLNLVQLVMNGISVKLQRDAITSNSWKIIHSDLPQSHGCELVVGASNSLRYIATKLAHEVQRFQSAWRQLDNIDQNCWVIDPLTPKPHHLYRRIKITISLSILINIDPTQPTALPDIRILGCDSDVSEYKNILSEHLELWDTNDNISDNLLLLLGMAEFPRASVSTDNKNKDDGLLRDEECCICFSLELGEDELPDRICNNEKCHRYFHTSCLLQWLQAVAGNQMIFNQLHGACPHCGENISCPVE